MTLNDDARYLCEPLDASISELGPPQLWCSSIHGAWVGHCHSTTIVNVVADIHVEYPLSLTDKYLVGDFLAESALSVLKSCTDR